MADPPELSDRVIPTWDDPVAASASTIIGGPLGRHALVGRNLFWTPLRVLLAFALITVALAWVKEAPCADGDWTGSKQYTHFCYSDTIPLYGIHGLDTSQIPYADTSVEYPVLTGGFMYVAAELGHAYDRVAVGSSILPGLKNVESYYIITCLLLTLCYLVVVWSTALLARRRIWDAAMVALSPLVFVHAFTNWDLFAMAFAGAGVLAWSRKHPVLAGVLLGLGAAAKLYPVFFLGPLLVLCLRAGRLRPWWQATVATVAAWAVINLPIAVLYPDNWSRFFALNTSRPADPDTVWNLLIQFKAGDFLTGGVSTDTQSPTLLNQLTLLLFLVVCGAIVLLGLAARRRPRLAQLLFLVVAGFLLTNKVWSPQYSLWLLPLAVLALPRWRYIMIWQITEAVLWVPRLLWYLGQDNNGLNVGWFLLAVIARDIAVAGLCALVVRDVLHPEHDVVRRDGVDDPAGGVLDGSDDLLVLRWGGSDGDVFTEEGDVRGDARGARLADHRSPSLGDHVRE